MYSVRYVVDVIHDGMIYLIKRGIHFVRPPRCEMAYGLWGQMFSLSNDVQLPLRIKCILPTGDVSLHSEGEYLPPIFVPA